ncbi:Uncharacterised protein [Chlamydia trachomatis]|nr:Uncharacterised protein [Chlamydia trachomatis]
MWVPGWNPGPLQGQQVLLTTKPSLQSPLVVLYNILNNFVKEFKFHFMEFSSVMDRTQVKFICISYILYTHSPMLAYFLRFIFIHMSVLPACISHA